MIYIPCYDADRPETAEAEELSFQITLNGTRRTVHYDTDGAFIVKINGKTQRAHTATELDAIQTAYGADNPIDDFVQAASPRVDLKRG